MNLFFSQLTAKMFPLLFAVSENTSNSIKSFFANYGFIIILVVLLVVMFVFSSRSQKKRQKQYQNMVDSLKPGSRVRTIGGIFGTVTAVKDDVVVVSVGPDKARLVFSKQAISSIEDAPVEATMDGEIHETTKK